MKKSKSYTLEKDVVDFIETLKNKMQISSASSLVERVFLSIMLTGSFSVNNRLMETCITKEVLEEELIEEVKAEETENEEPIKEEIKEPVEKIEVKKITLNGRSKAKNAQIQKLNEKIMKDNTAGE